MTTFFESVQNVAFTDNGAVTFNDTKDANLNFFAIGAAFKYAPEYALELFRKAYEEDPTLAIKNLFYSRDIRGGQGVRSVFRTCMNWLKEKHPDTVVKILSLIPHYGYWKDVVDLYQVGVESDINKAIKSLFATQLASDYAQYMSNEDKPISLAAKWFPMPNNTRNPEKKALAKELVHAIFESPKNARTIVGSLRRYLDICERKMAAGEWDAIDYEKVPSRAMYFHKEAFKRNDTTRFNQYLADVEAGRAKINASALYPFEIVRKYVVEMQSANRAKDMVLEALWNALPDYCSENPVNTNAICVVDVSGSMTVNDCRPLSSAIALGIYFSERNTSDSFKDQFITFSENPGFVNLATFDSLHDKIIHTMKADWGMNTDLEKVFDIVLERCVKNSVAPEDMPKTIYIISDMEFDKATNKSNTLFETIEAKYAEAGYERPQLVFWNVNANKLNFPVTKDEDGTVLVGGDSPIVLKYIMENTKPVEQMLAILNSERYAKLDGLLS